MSEKAKVACILFGLVALFIGMFLHYLILKKIDADSLMWFLYIFNIPFVIMLTIARDLMGK